MMKGRLPIVEIGNGVKLHKIEAENEGDGFSLNLTATGKR
jgi:hypothetical protein